MRRLLSLRSAASRSAVRWIGFVLAHALQILKLSDDAHRSIALTSTVRAAGGAVIGGVLPRVRRS